MIIVHHLTHEISHCGTVLEFDDPIFDDFGYPVTMPFFLGGGGGTRLSFDLIIAFIRTQVFT